MNFTPFPYSRQPLPIHQPHLMMQHRNTVETASESIVESSVKFELIQAVFISLINSDIATVRALCAVKLDQLMASSEENVKASETESINDDAEFSYWLNQLNQEQVIEIINMLDALKNDATAILAPLKGYPWERQREVVVHTFVSKTTNYAQYQLVAKGGAIYVKQLNGLEIMECRLMSFKQFLTSNRADLKNLNLSGLELNNVNLHGVTLNGTVLSCAKLNDAELSASTMMNVYLNDAELKGAQLAGVQMNGVHLNGADLSAANLSNANLINVRLQGANFTGTNLKHTVIKLALPEVWNHDTLDSELNHLTNSTTGSLFTVINTIDDKYITLKINLIHQIIDSLAQTSVSSISESLLAIFCSNPAYVQDEKIMRFMRERIVNTKIMTANRVELKVGSDVELRLLLTMVDAMKEENREKFMLENNGFFIQLIALCIENNAFDIKAQAAQLYDDYLNLEQLKGCREEMADYGCTDVLNSDENDFAYVFYRRVASENADANQDAHYTLLLTRKNIHDMLQSSPEHRWSDLYLRKNGESVLQSECNLTEIFNYFSLFNDAYQYHLKKSTFIKLLDTINLNFVSKNNKLASKDYRPLFREALNKPRVNEKLTGMKDQRRLSKIFRQLYVKGTNTITESHYNQIIDIYGLADADPVVIAHTLYFLADLSITFSSSYFFGDEGDSPVALRHYAAVLLTKAHALAENIFVDAEGKDWFDEWINKLLVGKNKTFTCTAVLRKAMEIHAEEKGFHLMLLQMKPPAWL